VQVRFLLGPAGSGKTFRCLAEIRAELLKSPDGPPLILLAPKQATFQLERQLLADPALKGYTRLRILSFERLAEFVLETLRVAPPRRLSDQGRVMVLRALLMRHERASRSRTRRRLPAPRVGRRMNRRCQAGMIEEEAKRRRHREPATLRSGDLGDRAGIEPFLQNLAEVDLAAHTLTIDRSDRRLNSGRQQAVRKRGPRRYDTRTARVMAGRFRCGLAVEQEKEL